MPSVSEILNREIGKPGKSKAYVADQLNVSERTIENYMKGSRQVKPDVLVKLSEILDFSLSELNEQNVPNTNRAPIQEEKKKGGKAEETKDLIGILKGLTVAHQEISSANHILADNERVILAKMPTIENDKASIALNEPAILKGLLGALAEIASGRRFHSKEEAVRELGRMLGLQESGSLKMGSTLSDEGK